MATELSVLRDMTPEKRKAVMYLMTKYPGIYQMMMQDSLTEAQKREAPSTAEQLLTMGIGAAVPQVVKMGTSDLYDMATGGSSGGGLASVLGNIFGSGGGSAASTAGANAASQAAWNAGANAATSTAGGIGGGGAGGAASAMAFNPMLAAAPVAVFLGAQALGNYMKSKIRPKEMLTTDEIFSGDMTTLDPQFEALGITSPEEKRAFIDKLKTDEDLFRQFTRGGYKYIDDGSRVTDGAMIRKPAMEALVSNSDLNPWDPIEDPRYKEQGFLGSNPESYDNRMADEYNRLRSLMRM